MSNEIESQDEIEQGYNEMTAQQQQPQAQQQQSEWKERVPPHSRPEGWTSKDGRFYVWKGYENLPAEYKKFIPKEDKWKSEPLKDPFDGQQYKYGVTIFDNGGVNVWSVKWEERQQQQGSSYGQRPKFFYKMVDIEECDLAQAKALLSAARGDKSKMYKRVATELVKSMETRPDGGKLISEKLVHVLELQERIEYG